MPEALSCLFVRHADQLVRCSIRFAAQAYSRNAISNRFADKQFISTRCGHFAIKPKTHKDKLADTNTKKKIRVITGSQFKIPVT